MTESLSLLQLNQRIARLVTDPSTQNVWVTAELSDVAVRGGHCYMELLQKDERGLQVAKARGVIWASNFHRIDAEFSAATGQRFATGLKLMVRASATMHPVYGLSLVITAVNPDYTMGDLLRRRREILMRLQKEGILEMNRQIEWTAVPLRIAVISAPGAAGYGDFINQLYHNPSRLRFTTRLFEAVMQGERTARSVIDALDRIAAEQDSWDGVVIIRGGGATSDLYGFEDYDLAANIAQFPLPVIVGIGHERDITLLDYVANMRVKTPTAAAEWLISRGDDALGFLQTVGNRILQLVNDRLTGYREQLSYFDGLLPTAATGACQRAQARLHSGAMALASVSSRRIAPQTARLDMMSEIIAHAWETTRNRRLDRLKAMEEMLGALSPEAVLRRGYSITRINGHTVTSASSVSPGDTVTTTLIDGTFTSTVK